MDPRFRGDDEKHKSARSPAGASAKPKATISAAPRRETGIIANITGVTTFDVYPFILLNLAFSLQSAYAAPLILLAQTRQADRDKAHAMADAEHRDALNRASEERQDVAARQTALLVEMVRQNTQLTETVKALTERVEALTAEVHSKVMVTKTA